MSDAASYLTIFGWKESQWKIAENYYNICHKKHESLEVSWVDMSMEAENLQEGRNNLKDALKIKAFWMMRRNDSPGTSSINIPYFPKKRTIAC